MINSVEYAFPGDLQMSNKFNAQVTFLFLDEYYFTIIIFQAYPLATWHKYSKSLPLYYRPISFDLPVFSHPKPSPFFNQDDQLYEDTEDDKIYDDDDDMINMMNDNKGRFIRNAREKDGTSVAYYNTLVKENRG